MWLHKLFIGRETNDFGWLLDDDDDEDFLLSFTKRALARSQLRLLNLRHDVWPHLPKILFGSSLHC